MKKNLVKEIVEGKINAKINRKSIYKGLSTKIYAHNMKINVLRSGSWKKMYRGIRIKDKV